MAVQGSAKYPIATNNFRIDEVGFSDEIRDELKAKGWVVEDSPKGPKLKKL